MNWFLYGITSALLYIDLTYPFPTRIRMNITGGVYVKWKSGIFGKVHTEGRAGQRFTGRNANYKRADP